MKLGTQKGLDPGHIALDGDPKAQVTVLDGDTAHPKRGHSPPIFGPCLLWPNS